MKRWLVFSVLLLVGVGSTAWFLRKRTVHEHPRGKKAAVVKRADLLQRVTAAGVLVPARRTIILPPYSGFVKELYVKVGDRVKRGDPIVSVVQSLSAKEEVYPIRAPFGGTVVQVLNAPGEYVKEGDTKKFIVRIDDLSTLFVQTDVPELDMVKIAVGQRAQIRPSALPNRPYEGIIREIALSARERDDWGWGNRNQVDYPVRVEILDPDEALRPGMSVLLDVITEKREGVLSLRHEFIRKDGDKHLVTVEGRGPQSVEVGLRNEEFYEIRSGLKEGERVLPVDFGSLPGDRG